MKEGYKRSELGEIPVEWEVVSLGDIIESLDGGVSVNSEDSLVDDESFGILKTSSVFGGQFFPNECKKIIDSEIGRAKINPKKDSIIISRMNTPNLVGECGYVSKSYPNLFLPDRLWQTTFKVDAKAIVKWLNYLLNSTDYKIKIKTTATGTSGSMKNISKGTLLGIKLPLPPLPEQQKIAAILSTVDEKIKVIEGRIAQTQELKKGLMQKLLTEGIGHSRFKDSALGRIPESWEVVSFGNIATNITNKFPFDEGTCIDLEHISQNTGRRLGFGEISSKSSAKNHFQKNDILFGKLRPYLKKFWFAEFEGGSSSELLIFRAKNNINPKYIFYTTQLESFIENSVSKSFGTKMPRTSWNIVKEFFLGIPKEEEQNKIVNILTSIDEKLEILESKKQHFQALKKGLMQQLLTGRVRVG